MKNYVQDGKTITHTPTVAVVSGGAVLITALLAVAVASVAANEPGEFTTEGVYELPKATADEITIGAKLYWDDSAKNFTTTATDNVQCGKAWATAANGDTLVAVKINA